MVLGLRSKTRKANSVEVEYIIHVQEIKPWPPSKSLKSIEAVLLQWENGDQSSGILTSSISNGKIEFDEPFRLKVVLCKEGKSKSHMSYQKNYLEFHIHESRKDKAVKGQLLGSAAVNIADYGIVKNTTSIYAPMNCKRSFRSSVQPVLFVKVQLYDKDDGTQSTAEFMSEENYEETEIASITDDDDYNDNDIPSHSSRTSLDFESSGGLISPIEKNGSEPSKNDMGIDNGADALHLNGNLNTVSSTLLPSDHSSMSNSPEMKPMPSREKSDINSLKSSSSPVDSIDSHEVDSTVANESIRTQENSNDSFAAKVVSTETYIEVDIENEENDRRENGHEELMLDEKSSVNNQAVIKTPEYSTEKQTSLRSDTLPVTRRLGGVQGSKLTNNKLQHVKSVQFPYDSTKSKRFLSNLKLIDKMKEVDYREDATTSTNYLTSERKQKAHRLDGRKVELESRVDNTSESYPTSEDNEKDGRKVELESRVDNTSTSYPTSEENEKTCGLDESKVELESRVDNTSTNYPTSERTEKTQGLNLSKVEFESKVNMLEEELREAAAIEISLYSIVAEHGSSINKVHAPARRLSRFYLHACKAESKSKQSSAARAVGSGLVLVSKACGNDVSRLAFWLSNSIVLRAIISKAVKESPVSDGLFVNVNGGGKEANKNFSLERIKVSSNEEEENNTLEISDDWEDPQTFTVALERIEAWIFSRIVESIWWQTLTPHMQSAAAKGNSKKTNARKYSLSNEDQGNFSIDLWKKAFKDSCERLCPIRAGGHECGCLPVLARLVMEQLVNRLDVAMFNAILRDSAEEMPTDPVSDPISDSRVLPIPVGKSSFGSGVQLKNAVGNWSRWLTDLFGIDDDCPEDESNPRVEERPKLEATFKAFHLLNALSDLMMLPWEMLADRSTRKEVCPTFGSPLIKRVLDNFVPDEFFPEPIPASIFYALDSEDSIEGESISSFPVMATPPVYMPPSSVSLAGVIGEVGSNHALSRSGSVLKKSYTSDDELDELDSPISSIINGKWIPKSNGGRNVVRYKLLREVWTMER